MGMSRLKVYWKKFYIWFNIKILGKMPFDADKLTIIQTLLQNCVFDKVSQNSTLSHLPNDATKISFLANFSNGLLLTIALSLRANNNSLTSGNNPFVTYIEFQSAICDVGVEYSTIKDIIDEVGIKLAANKESFTDPLRRLFNRMG